MKKIVAIAALAALSVATAVAGDVGAEVRWADKTNEQAFTFNQSVDVLNLGVEVETINGKQNKGTRNVYTGSVGLPFTFGKVTVQPFVQAGVETVSFARDRSILGGGVKSELKLVGPVSVGAEYRYRESFEGPAYDDQRATGYVKVDLTKNWSTKAVYHNHFGDWSDKQYGLGVSFKF